MDQGERFLIFVATVSAIVAAVTQLMIYAKVSQWVDGQKAQPINTCADSQKASTCPHCEGPMGRDGDFQECDKCGYIEPPF